jgi:serine/threonine protein kinase
MTPETWKEVESIFELACEMPATARQSFLSEKCAGKSDIRSEVEKLLRNVELAGTFLESPVWTDTFADSSVKKVISSSLGDRPDLENDLAGVVVGPYRLITEIGRGGMGTVYRGERIDGEFDQEVAIKLLKRGMDSDFVVKRFRHERQILASFEHPFISRLLDGGTTGEGVPFFVMEYIGGGVTMNEWCDRRQLDLAARVRLFLKVCSALEYAHERKIVHRDIKPSNILVNRSGAPKLLDFGIAKILDPDLIHESFNPTASMVRMMTPDYASPEQILGLEITPASDIYSMGVLLYELLSGHRPYLLVEHDINELSAIICEVVPVAPSQSLLQQSTLMKRYSSNEDLSEARNTSLDELISDLSLLDGIVLKALAKDPESRFASIGEFADALSPFSKIETFSNSQGPDSNKDRLIQSSKRRSIAVLPFRTITFSPGEDTDEQFVSIGLADSIISRLGRIHQLLVHPASSIKSLGENYRDPIRAGRHLNVDFILDGNLKVAGDRFRLGVQLLDVKGNAAVWATSIDDKAGNLFSLEEALSNQLMEALVPRISSSDLAAYARRGTDSPEAFEYYLRGRYHFSLMTEEHLAKSFLFFHRAIASDPNYAHAYCGIANYYNWLGVIGVLPPSECFPPALEASRKAVELDPDLSEAHASLGFSLHVGLFDWKNADEHFQKALKLNRNNTNAHLWYSTFLFMAGRFERGFEYAIKATELEPLSPYSHYNIGSGLYYARRFREAKAQHEKVVDEFPDYGFGYYGLSKIQRYLGEIKLATETNNEAYRLLDGSILVQISTAECLAAECKKDESLSKLRELEEIAEHRYVSPYMLALVYSFLDDQEKVLELLERSVDAGEAWLCCAPVEARFEKVFKTARFQAVLQAINHPLLHHKSENAAGEITREFGDLTTVVIDENI